METAVGGTELGISEVSGDSRVSPLTKEERLHYDEALHNDTLCVLFTAPPRR